MPISIDFLASVVADSVIYASVALGVYVAFGWMRFPDLTPDGSFVSGQIAFIFLLLLQGSTHIAYAAAILSGCGLGVATATVARKLTVPPVVASLLTFLAVYSLGLALMKSPTLQSPATIATEEIPRWHLIGSMALYLLTLTLAVLLLRTFSRTIWGLRLRAIGENPLLAADLNQSQWYYTALGLGIGNSLVALGGALHAERVGLADINSGTFTALHGLCGMLLGISIGERLWGPLSGRMSAQLVAVALGATAYRLLTRLALWWGLPPAYLRSVTALLLLTVFVAMRVKKNAPLRQVRWGLE